LLGKSVLLAIGLALFSLLFDPENYSELGFDYWGRDWGVLIIILTVLFAFMGEVLIEIYFSDYVRMKRKALQIGGRENYRNTLKSFRAARTIALGGWGRLWQHSLGIGILLAILSLVLFGIVWWRIYY